LGSRGTEGGGGGNILKKRNVSHWGDTKLGKETRSWIRWMGCFRRTKVEKSRKRNAKREWLGEKRISNAKKSWL